MLDGMEDEPTFPKAFRRELVRLDALEAGLQRGLCWEEKNHGRWKVSCESAFRWDFPDRFLSDLGRIPDEAGWTAAWEALSRYLHVTSII